MHLAISIAECKITQTNRFDSHGMENAQTANISLEGLDL